MNCTVIKVTTAGSAGSATGSGVSSEVIRGKVWGVYLNFHASAPGTTDTTVKTTGNGPPSYNIVVATDTATDAMLNPAAKPVDNANTAITNSHRPFPICDTITVSVAQCDALTDAVVAHVLWEP